MFLYIPYIPLLTVRPEFLQDDGDRSAVAAASAIPRQRSGLIVQGDVITRSTLQRRSRYDAVHVIIIMGI